VFKNLQGLETFIEKMESRFRILEYKVYYVLEDLRREEFLSNPEHIKMLV